jgi:hypothetical protein
LNGNTTRIVMTPRDKISSDAGKARPDGERPTEDDLARAALGGPKGSPELPAAPLTKREAEQNSPNDDPGHVA